MKISILYQSDSNYAIYMGVSIYSLLINNSQNDICIYVLDDDIDTENKKKISDMVEAFNQSIIFVKCDELLQDHTISKAFAYTGFRKNRHSYYKLFFDRLIKDDLDRIIYIDCDTVIDGDLCELAKTDIMNKPIAMVLDSLVMDSRESIGLLSSDSYFNSGVILIDVVAWKKRKCSQRILEHVMNVRKYGTVDQDVLNVEFKGEIAILPIMYNLQPIHIVLPTNKYKKIYEHKEPYYSEDEIEEACKNPKIIHFLRFLGESPWDEGNCHPSLKYYDKYFYKSPWNTTKKTKRKLKPVFRIEKAMYRFFPASMFWRIFHYVHENMIRKSNNNEK